MMLEQDGTHHRASGVVQKATKENIGVIRLPKVRLGEAAELLARRKASVEQRRKRVDRDFHRSEELPPVSLYRAVGHSIILDGHHRVSATSLPWVERIDAEVTEFNSGSW